MLRDAEMGPVGRLIDSIAIDTAEQGVDKFAQQEAQRETGQRILPSRIMILRPA